VASSVVDLLIAVSSLE
jgi:hypothetical protein